MKGLIIAAIVAVPLALAGGVAISTYNTGISHENGIMGTYDENKIKYNAFAQSVTESAGVADAYKDAVAEVISGALQNRYGDGGASALLLALTEDNPEVDMTLYKTIQDQIEIGRTTFANAQKLLIDKCVAYTNSLEKFPGNLVYGLMNFPAKVDPNQKKPGSVCAPVVSAATSQTFETGEDGGVNPFGNND